MLRLLHLGDLHLGGAWSGFSARAAALRQAGVLEVLEKTTDSIRERFGKFAIRRGLMLEDPTLSGFCPYDEHTVHPIALRK